MLPDVNAQRLRICLRKLDLVTFFFRLTNFTIIKQDNDCCQLTSVAYKQQFSRFTKTFGTFFHIPYFCNPKLVWVYDWVMV